MLDAYGFGYRNLNMVYKIAVPDRLKNRVGKPEHQDILDRFLSEVMVDAVYLPLGKTCLDYAVKLVGALEVSAEWLFDNEPDFFALGEAGAGKSR
jgi:hypothetical protein